MSIEAKIAEPQAGGRLGFAGVAALGVVFGDIGTSPLYTLKTVLDYTGPSPDAAAILGALSLIVWTLFLITTVKYVNIAMRIDNDGEGGIIALMTLVGVKQHHRPLIVAAGLFGAALIYGDGAITPAISVLSRSRAWSRSRRACSPTSCRRRLRFCWLCSRCSLWGRPRSAELSGPSCWLWFVRSPRSAPRRHPASGRHRRDQSALRAVLLSGGIKGFLVLGGVFLCVTGAEAL